ncbi:hypothetical protein H696_05972 [Fonticula alba]|uniref:Uncharacterized protein n=1 Tax=Fonticula alba TaxID=691883 RepID=A0A058YZZ7_FONAL|nr:hypothetical protein H696_05972 [Fonticula alba]KCV67574.1 hypothetical protein H696_05972 [Fonticula alba]|eukprot:XP_009498015.1 hypothetical protein H696_05972 [Fonticula alba]
MLAHSVLRQIISQRVSHVRWLGAGPQCSMAVALARTGDGQDFLSLFDCSGARDACQQLQQQGRLDTSGGQVPLTYAQPAGGVLLPGPPVDLALLAGRPDAPPVVLVALADGRLLLYSLAASPGDGPALLFEAAAPGPVTALAAVPAAGSHGTHFHLAVALAGPTGGFALASVALGPERLGSWRTVPGVDPVGAPAICLIPAAGQLSGPGSPPVDPLPGFCGLVAISRAALGGFSPGPGL